VLIEIVQKTKSGLTNGIFCPPADIFSAIQAKCLQKLKYADGYYSSFVMTEQYQKILTASLHADERRKAGLNVLATALSDNRCLPSNFGIKVDLKTDKVDSLFKPIEVIQEKTLISKFFGGFYGGSKKTVNSSQKSETDDTNDVIPVNAQGKFLRSTLWRVINYSTFLPSWWWSFVKIEIVLPNEKSSSHIVTSAGLSRSPTDGNVLVKEIEEIILQSNIHSTKLCNASSNVRHNINADGSDPIPAATKTKCSSVIGHHTLRRVAFVDRSIIHYGAQKVQRSGLYGTVMLTGIIKCHHVVTSSDAPVSSLTMFGDRKQVSHTPYVGRPGSRRLSSISSKTPLTRSTTSTQLLATNKNSDIHKINFVTNYTVLTEFNGKGRLLMFDPGSNVLKCRLRLEFITEIGISQEVMNGIELYEGQGDDRHCSFLFVARGVVCEDPCRLAQRWIDHMLPYCSPDCEASSYVHYGNLKKRGVTNSSWKNRFFILTSDPSLVYYKIPVGQMCEDVHGSAYKGEIDLLNVNEKDIVRDYMKPNVSAAVPDMSINTVDRTYHMQAEDMRTAELWYGKLLAAIGVEKK